MAQATHHFPKSFRWGTATAAHQVEGDNTENQWWDWEHQPGRIQNGDKSGRACDMWQKPEADFDRMVALGLNAHRLSIEWSRVEPRDGQFDSAALERYRDMLLQLRRRDIEPMVTLHHFTNPMWLMEQGEWLDRENVVRKFARFVAEVVRHLGDVCDLWCTINEPNVYGIGTRVSGAHPPGIRNDFRSAISSLQNMLHGHAAAWQVLHDAQRTARVGFAHHMRVLQPLTRSPLDALVASQFSRVFNDASIDAFVQGRWTSLLSRMGNGSDARKLRGTLDWIGLNYYTRERVAFDRGAAQSMYGRLAKTPGAEQSDFDYGETHPEGMMYFLQRLARLNMPIYITENGLPDDDDSHRAGFLLRHLKVVWTAINFNIDLLGYYHWTMVDNFEWSEGWRMKFGLYSMNPVTQARTLRNSGKMYGDIAKTGTLRHDHAEQYAPEVRGILFK